MIVSTGAHEDDPFRVGAVANNVEGPSVKASWKVGSRGDDLGVPVPRWCESQSPPQVNAVP